MTCFVLFCFLAIQRNTVVAAVIRPDSLMQGNPVAELMQRYFSSSSSDDESSVSRLVMDTSTNDSSDVEPGGAAGDADEQNVTVLISVTTEPAIPLIDLTESDHSSVRSHSTEDS